MRKISQQIGQAFKLGQKLSVGNTVTDGTTVWLHGNAIVRRDEDGIIEFSLAGWPTPTTRERINGVLGVCQSIFGVTQKRGIPHVSITRIVSDVASMEIYPMDTTSWISTGKR